MPKLLVEHGVGNIAACRHVDVVHNDRALAVGLAKFHREMTRMPTPANIAALFNVKGAAREWRPVIALMPRHRDMREAVRRELEPRELAFDTFDLLQAEHIWPLFFDEAADEINLSLTDLMFQVANRERMDIESSGARGGPTSLAQERHGEKRQGSSQGDHEQERGPR